MPLYETDDIVWKISGGFNQWVIGFAWTLKRNEEGSKGIVHTSEKFSLLVKFLRLIIDNIKGVVNRINMKSHVLTDVNKCGLPGVYINPVFAFKNILTYYNEILFSHTKNEILLFATWMDLEGITLSEVSQTEKDKYCMISLMCGIKQKSSKIQRTDWWLPDVEGAGWAKWVRGYKLPVINPEDVMYSTVAIVTNTIAYLKVAKSRS